MQKKKKKSYQNSPVIMVVKTTAKLQLRRKSGIENESGVKFLSVSTEKSQWIPERARESGLAFEG